MTTVSAYLNLASKTDGSPVIKQYYLTSFSQIKRDVVCQALNLDPAALISLNSDPTLPDQPVNHQGIITCKRRIPPDLLEDYGHAVISIENYLYQQGLHWYDAVCVIIASNGRIACRVGGRIAPDQDHIRRYLKEVPGFGQTFGAWAQAKNIFSSDVDWQAHYMDGGRRRQISTVLKALLNSEYKLSVATLPSHMRYYANFPKPGVLFKDISPLYNEEDFLMLCVKAVSKVHGLLITHVFGVESRGFPLAALMARKLMARFHMVRKAGKLPVPSKSVEYGTEYSKDRLEIENMDLAYAKVLIVDDLIATGGSIVAAAQLVRQDQTQVSCFAPVHVEEMETDTAEKFEKNDIRWIRLTI